jgi:thiamine kinase-like enzyme
LCSFALQISLLKESLDSDLRLVFAHNDAMPANMVITAQGTVRFIDLEYSGPNPAALDIAGLFNE